MDAVHPEKHAPIAIKAAGVSCVIAETFARIFYRNAINIGLPIIECKEAALEIKAGDEVEVNFDTGVITDKTTGKSFQGSGIPTIYAEDYRLRGTGKLHQSEIAESVER